MKDYILVYQNLLSESLKIPALNSEYDPVLINKLRFDARTSFIALLAYLKTNEPLETESLQLKSLFAWVDSFFGSESIFYRSLISLSEMQRKQIETALQTNANYQDADLFTINELLLGIEAVIGQDDVEITSDKNLRNTLGSYYTPKNMAFNMVSETLDLHLDINHGIKGLEGIEDTIDDSTINSIISLSVADFSCGGGIFFTSYLQYVSRIFDKINLENKSREKFFLKIIENFHGFDLDPVALELAKFNIVDLYNLDITVKDAGFNFIHGNFLLRNEIPISNEQKTEIFKQGYLYDQRLGISKSDLQKYDIILGNPPWERIRFEEKKFYALHDNFVSASHVKSDRIERIKSSNNDNQLLEKHAKKISGNIEKAKSLINSDPFYKYSSPGELNTYSLFTEACFRLISEKGCFGILVKSSIITSQANKEIFNQLVQSKSLLKVIDFINTDKIFPIDGRTRFCFLLGSKKGKETFNLLMNQTKEDFSKHSNDFIQLSGKSLKILNPQTKMVPNISNQQEIDLILRLTESNTLFYKAHNKVKFGRLVHFTNHSDYISKKETGSTLPIYEGKFINRFDSKYSGFNEVEFQDRYKNRASSKTLPDSIKHLPSTLPESRFFIEKSKWNALSKNYSHVEYMLAWRSLTSPTNARTCVSTIIPFQPTSQSIQFLISDSNEELLYLCGLFNSAVFDYLARKNISGIDLTQTIIKQLPVPREERLNLTVSFNGKEDTVKDHIINIVKELISYDARQHRISESKLTPKFDPNDRSRLIKYLDLLFLFGYRINEENISPIITEFPQEYSILDISWFQQSLEILVTNKTISSSSRLITHEGPSI